MMQMQMTLKILAILLLAFSTAANADLTVNDFRQLTKGNQTERALVESYIGGVGKGFLWANALLKQEKLFCFKGDLTTQQLQKISSDAIPIFLKKNPSAIDEPIEMVLLIRLKELYPCK